MAFATRDGVSIMRAAPTEGLEDFFARPEWSYLFFWFFSSCLLTAVALEETISSLIPQTLAVCGSKTCLFVKKGSFALWRLAKQLPGYIGRQVGWGHARTSFLKTNLSSFHLWLRGNVTFPHYRHLCSSTTNLSFLLGLPSLARPGNQWETGKAGTWGPPQNDITCG